MRRWGGLSLALTSGALALGVLALGRWVMLAGPLPGERRALVWIHDTGGTFDRAALVVSDLTELVPLAVVAVGVLIGLLATHRPADASYFVSGIAVVWAVNPLLKEVVGRSRPDLWPLPASVSEYSFPSGHAANTLALVGGLVMILHGRVAACGAAALVVAVGLSQLVLGRHYPSDLLAGWLWAGAWIVLLASVRRRRTGPGYEPQS